jgi:hypothetical protein
MRHFVFNFTHGLGNRLCNLMNMFYIHEKYPDALIYINWRKNNHCNISIHDIFDLSEYNYILSSDEYYDNNISSKYKTPELWANTSTNERTRWDNIDEWEKHNCIISVSFSIYSFVTPEYCIKTFNSLILKESINKLVATKQLKYGYGKRYIHFRNGDLINCLSVNHSSADTHILLEKMKNLKHKYEIVEYNKMEVDRQHNDVLDSVADLIFLSKCTKLVGYCPYSHFSSWIFLLSSSFINNMSTHPIFNYKFIDVILLD